MGAIINVIHGDGVKALEAMKENQYDLAICDVNYGIQQDGRNNHTRGKKAKSKDYRSNTRYDDVCPDASYFDDLKRKTNNQILWGANHFIDNMPFNVSSPCWIVWDKENGKTDFADCELAWTSFKTAVRIFKFRWQGMLQGDMKNKQEYIHPNMKPIQLYKWTLKNYAEKSDKILDTHGGSFSHAIAAIDLGYNLDIYEIDDKFYDSGADRIKRHINQLDLSRPPCKVNFIEQ